MAARMDGAGLERVRKEKNNYMGGREGSKVPIKGAVVKSVRHNPTEGGGINRRTTGV